MCKTGNKNEVAKLTTTEAGIGYRMEIAQAA
jgi:hypothetical protein